MFISCRLQCLEGVGMCCYLQGEDPPKICGLCGEMSGLKSARVGVRNVQCVFFKCVVVDTVGYHDIM